MFDFYTVIVSNDDCVSLGMSMLQDTSPATVPSIKVHFNDYILMLFICFCYIIIVSFRKIVFSHLACKYIIFFRKNGNKQIK